MSLEIKQSELNQSIDLPVDNALVLVHVRGFRRLLPARFKGVVRGIPQFVSLDGQNAYDILGWMYMPMIDKQGGHDGLAQDANAEGDTSAAR